jgi:hypothetical protein
MHFISRVKFFGLAVGYAGYIRTNFCCNLVNRLFDIIEY